MCTNSSWILLEFYKSNSVYYSGSRETSHLAYYFGTKKPLHSILESGQKYISLFPDLKKQNNFLLPKCQHCGGTLTLDKLWDWLLARLPWQLHGLAFEHALCDIPFAKFVMCPGNIMSFAVMLCVSRGIWVILLVCIAWRLHDVGGRAFFVPILCQFCAMFFLSWRISIWLLFSVSIYNPRKQLINNTYFQKQFVLSKFCSKIGNCIINWQNRFKNISKYDNCFLKKGILGQNSLFVMFRIKGKGCLYTNFLIKRDPNWP